MREGPKRLVAAIAVLLALLAPAATGCGGGGDGEGGSGSTGAAGSGSSAEGFGSEASGAQAKQVEAALHDYLDARAAGEWKQACSYLTKGIRKVFGRLAAGSKQAKGSSCADFLASSNENVSSSQRARQAKVDVESVRVKGDQGYILYEESGGSRYAMPVAEEAGGWKLAAGSGTPLS